MNHSLRNIESKRVEDFLTLVKFWRSHDDRPRAARELSALVSPLNMDELFGLILWLLKEDIAIVLTGLEVIAFVYQWTEREISPEIEPIRSLLISHVPFLEPYNRPDVPRDFWEEAAREFVAMYEEQITRGIAPNGRMDEWIAFSKKHIPAIEGKLLKAGIAIQHGDFGS